MRDKSDRTITYVFCRDIHLTLTFTSLYKKIRLKESEVWRKVVSNKIIVTLVTQGLPSSFLSCPVASLSSLRVSLRNSTGEERRRQTLCNKRENNFVRKTIPPNFPFAKDQKTT